MELTFLVTNPIELILPRGVISWFSWFLFLGAILVINRRWWAFNQPLNARRRRILIFLILCIPISVLVLPSLRSSSESSILSIPLLAAFPWFLAAGLFGPTSATALGLLSGLFISLWGIHDAFLPLELAFLASLLGWMFYQDYRTLFYQWLRHPLVAALVLIVIQPILHFLIVLVSSPVPFPSRVEIAINNFLPRGTVFGVIFLVSGIVSEVIAFLFKPYWGAQRTVRPSPGEAKLSTRFLFIVLPLSIFLLVILIVGDWLVVSKASRDMISRRMVNAGETTTESIPFFLEMGQNLIIRLVDEPVFLDSPDKIQQRLSSERRDVPYFNQFIYLDTSGAIIATDPANAVNNQELTDEETSAIGLASLVPFQIVTMDPISDSSAASLSFIVAKEDQSGELQGILIGRSDLAANPFAKPILTGLNSLSELEGEGILLDENGRILYHPDPSRLMSIYPGDTAGEAALLETRSSDGEGAFVYSRPVVGRPWRVVITVPSGFAQQQALSIALPLVGIISLLALLAIFVFRYGLRSITSSLQDLTVEADRMAHGQLNDPLEPGGEDEVGQLRGAFEELRASLKSRLDELNRLLLVSQGIASSFDIEESLQPVLASALDSGASAARVYLIPSILPDSRNGQESKYQFGSGPKSEIYAFLDSQVVALVEHQEILKLSNATRPRLFKYPQDKVPPQAILGVALRHENLFYGVLWQAFEGSRQFADEEVRYLVTLAGQAALAVANARLYLSAEIGRQRLESIIIAIPDPVLVTDQNDNLLFINPAAQERFHLYEQNLVGKHVSKLISDQIVIQLLQNARKDPHSEELSLADGKTFIATTLLIEGAGIQAGRICILRDVTSFKQLDNLKSEFVSTVSHDLRSPLALIQGYISMLKMVGELNDQQTNILNKITAESVKMNQLVTNLLDLGRIEAGVGLKLERRPADDVVNQVISEIQEQADQKRVSLIVDEPSADLPSVQADQPLLQQAIHNLVDNAIKFTEPGGKVTLNLQITSESVTYIVRDNGIGISPTDQQNIFEKFFRANENGDNEDEGSGLGLAIVKSIADKHGGKVEVESKLGEGSSFLFTIPLNQE